MAAAPEFRISLDPAAGEPPYVQIVRQVSAAIRASVLPAGAVLPPVRHLARGLRINVNTVARAYAELGALGLVTARRRGGTHVAEQAGERIRELRSSQLRQLADAALGSALAQGHTPEELEAALGVAVARWRASSRRSAARRPATWRAHAGEVRFAGSHDLSVELLRSRLGARRPPVRLAITFSGSLEGLVALARGEADVAGCHLLDEDTGDYNAPFVRRLLPGRPVVLVTLASRQQGFMLRPGLEAAEVDAAAIARRRWRVANRQRGSGTRVLLDHVLHRAGIEPGAVSGYGLEFPTHLAVAQAVTKGEADVGLGIEAAARAYGLKFVPVTPEPYELAIPAELAGQAPVQALLQTLASPTFRRVVATLEGYDLARAGALRRVA